MANIFFTIAIAIYNFLRPNQDREVWVRADTPPPRRDLPVARTLRAGDATTASNGPRRQRTEPFRSYAPGVGRRFDEWFNTPPQAALALEPSRRARAGCVVHDERSDVTPERQNDHVYPVTATPEHPPTPDLLTAFVATENFGTIGARVERRITERQMRLQTRRPNSQGKKRVHDAESSNGGKRRKESTDDDFATGPSMLVQAFSPIYPPSPSIKDVVRVEERQILGDGTTSYGFCRGPIVFDEDIDMALDEDDEWLPSGSDVATDSDVEMSLSDSYESIDFEVESLLLDMEFEVQRLSLDEDVEMLPLDEDVDMTVWGVEVDRLISDMMVEMMGSDQGSETQIDESSGSPSKRPKN